VESTQPLPTTDKELTTFLNTPVRVSVAADGIDVGQASLDLLPLATQASSSVQARLLLQSIPSSEGAGSSLIANANVTVTVAFFKDLEEGPNDDGSPQPEGPSRRVPFQFVDGRFISETSVVELRPVGVHQLSTTFLSAAGAAPGGLGVRAGLVWKSAGKSWGCASCLGVLAEQSLLWERPWRTFVPRMQFQALQRAVTMGEPVFFEVARYVPCGVLSRAASLSGTVYNLLSTCM
jgi:hypothetical protein